MAILSEKNVSTFTIQPPRYVFHPPLFRGTKIALDISCARSFLPTFLFSSPNFCPARKIRQLNDGISSTILLSSGSKIRLDMSSTFYYGISPFSSPPLHSLTLSLPFLSAFNYAISHISLHYTSVHVYLISIGRDSPVN